MKERKRGFTRIEVDADVARQVSALAKKEGVTRDVAIGVLLAHGLTKRREQPPKHPKKAGWRPVIEYNTRRSNKWSDKRERVWVNHPPSRLVIEETNGATRFASVQEVADWMARRANRDGHFGTLQGQRGFLTMVARTRN